MGIALPTYRRHAIVLALLCLSATFAAGTDAQEKALPGPRDDELTALAKDPAKVRTGKRLYAGTCLQCHGDEKNGVDAPSNLFDTKWYHGELPSRIERNIAEGILEKGMPAWKEALPPEDVAALTAYLLNRQPAQTPPAP
jgi:mono/diheme cytochrome c family protein